MDPSGTKEIKFSPILQRCFSRHAKDYARLSSTPEQFEAFTDAVGEMMKTEPNYFAEQLADIHVPVAIVQSEHDQFIKLEHAEYLARSIPNAKFIFAAGEITDCVRPKNDRGCAVLSVWYSQQY